MQNDYDLINSKAIRDYCRKIKYQFNTEELAALVYRNKKMDIFEKISKYQDLIDNYPDMEVIERINCEHYDSVKTMIQNEINRLKSIYEDFVKKDENSVYTWNEYNRTTKEYSRSYEIINNLKKTYEETYKSVKDYINEFDDTISFIITKKFFGKKERLIYAHYSVIDKTPKLVKIYDKEDDFLDIDNIFVYMPTPFKKGDILISENPSRCNYGDNGEIFVLEYLRTWRPNIKEYLAKGNCDSSDMSGSGYYLYDNKAQIILEDKWDYDSFEYYEGKIEGNNRILKAISSYLKGEIGMELLIHAYDVFKIESINKTMPDFYTEEGLKKAGFSDWSISHIKREHEKIYNMSDEEKMNYIKYNTNGLKGIPEENIKQIETDFYDNVFVLTLEGILYKNGELIDGNIEQIYMFDGCHLYKVTDNNQIRPIEEDKKWDDIDTYLNNNDCSYKKILFSTMNIVALTNNGKIREIHQYPACIVPENYMDVEDIKIEEIDGLDTPFIYKNNQYIKLYEN